MRFSFSARVSRKQSACGSQFPRLRHRLGRWAQGFMQYPLSGSPRKRPFYSSPPKINRTPQYKPVLYPYSTRTVRPVLDSFPQLTQAANWICIGSGQACFSLCGGLRKLSGLTISSWSRLKLNPKESGRMAATRQRLRPRPSWTLRRRPSFCLFVVAVCRNLPARAESQCILWAGENAGCGGLGFLSLRLRCVPPLKINRVRPCTSRAALVSNPCHTARA